MKRSIRFLILIIIIAGGVYAYYHFSKSEKAADIEHLAFINNEASAVVQFYSYSDLILGKDALSMVSGSRCEFKIPDELQELTKTDEFKKGCISIFGCNDDRVELLLETENRIPLPEISGWETQKTGEKNLTKFTRSGTFTSNSSNHLFSEKEKPFLLEGNKLRMLVIHQNCDWIDDENEMIFQPDAKYTVHEISGNDSHLHFCGFSIPFDIEVVSGYTEVDKSFISMIPKSFQSFSWKTNDIKDNEVKEILNIQIDDKKNLIAVRANFEKENIIRLTNSASQLINPYSHSDVLENAFSASEEKPKYYSLYKDWLIFSDDKSDLSYFSQYVKSKDLWSNSEEYEDFSKRLSMDATSINFYNLNEGKNLISQMNGTTNSVRYNIIDLFGHGHENISNEVQETEVRKELITSADHFEFVNHYTGEKEWLFQDEDLNLILMTKKNEVIFKRTIPDKVIGDFKMVDALNNKKFQIAFNTSNHIFIIDRKGRDLQNFPIKLPYEASNELSVVDYDNNNNYRLIVGLDNGNILNYTASGKKVRGWNYNAGDIPIIYPITHLRLGNKDYLFALNDNYEIQLLDRKGQVRHPLDSQPEGLNNMAFEILQNENIQKSGIRYSNLEGEEVDFIFGKSES